MDPPRPRTRYRALPPPRWPQKVGGGMGAKVLWPLTRKHDRKGGRRKRGFPGGGGGGQRKVYYRKAREGYGVASMGKARSLKTVSEELTVLPRRPSWIIMYRHYPPPPHSQPPPNRPLASEINHNNKCEAEDLPDSPLIRPTGPTHIWPTYGVRIRIPYRVYHNLHSRPTEGLSPSIQPLSSYIYVWLDYRLGLIYISVGRIPSFMT